MMRVYPQQRSTHIPKLEDILSMMLADKTLSKPKRYPRAYANGTDEKKGQVYGISGELQRLGKSAPGSYHSSPLPFASVPFNSSKNQERTT